MLFAGNISVPRTGAVAYELGFKALFPGVPIIVFIIGYFAIALYFSLDVNKMINKVGKFLTPVLVVVLLGIIIKGVLTPVGLLPIAVAGIDIIKLLKGAEKFYPKFSGCSQN